MPVKLHALYFSSSDRSNRTRIAHLVKQGKIRKIGPKLFTSLSEEKIGEYLKRNWSQVVDIIFPGSHISFRTAFEFKPSAEGFIFLTSKSERIIEYPGLKIKFVTGSKSIQSDNKFIGSLVVSSFERTLLENLSTVSKKWALRNVQQSYIENKLEDILITSGEEALNEVRDKAKNVAHELNFEKAFKKLNNIIGALLGTKASDSLKTSAGLSRARGIPFDVNCIRKLEILFGELRTSSFKAIGDPLKSQQHFFNKAFFESYFSNYIEGTTFEIAEAEEIIFDKKIIETRPKDSHDILGVFKIVSDKNEIFEVPTNYAHLEEIIKRRHFMMLQYRDEVHPGLYKNKVNRAGNTIFVHPEYVRGSLSRGMELYLALHHPMAKAIFISFLITEVHPFNDGNGRLARIMFNSEMQKENLSTMIIPNVYREDYLLSLRAMSRRERPNPLIKTHTKAQEFSAIDFLDYKKALEYLVDHNWFLEPNEGKIVYK